MTLRIIRDGIWLTTPGWGLMCMCSIWGSLFCDEKTADYFGGLFFDVEATAMQSGFLRRTLPTSGMGTIAVVC
jgi:hypothetical protein